MRNECDEAVREAPRALAGGGRERRCRRFAARHQVVPAADDYGRGRCGSRCSSRWFVTYVRRERPFTGLCLSPRESRRRSRSAMSAAVMLVRGMAGRTLVASTGMKSGVGGTQKSHRIMISKGTVP